VGAGVEVGGLALLKGGRPDGIDSLLGIGLSGLPSFALYELG
jgi:hypothetical protein